MNYIPVIIFILAFLQGAALRAASSMPIEQTTIELPVKPGKKKKKRPDKSGQQQSIVLMILPPLFLVGVS